MYDWEDVRNIGRVSRNCLRFGDVEWISVGRRGRYAWDVGVGLKDVCNAGGFGVEPEE